MGTGVGAAMLKWMPVRSILVTPPEAGRSSSPSKKSAARISMQDKPRRHPG